jgi:hypothetical protein
LHQPTEFVDAVAYLADIRLLILRVFNTPTVKDIWLKLRKKNDINNFELHGTYRGLFRNHMTTTKHCGT